MRIIVLHIIFLSFCLVGRAQNDDIKNQLVIQFEKNMKELRKEIQGLRTELPDIIQYEKISDDLSLYLITFKGEVTLYEVDKVSKLPGVIFAHHPTKIQTRADTIPNDIRFSGQWHFDILRATEAWAVTTGGKTYNGEEIVIAVLDDGFHISHEDLADNIWINRGEIEGDGKDNDNNGYIDDINGPNLVTKKGDHPKKNHGTAVCGIVGAVTNNNIGVAGINWNIKLLPISEVTSDIRIIQALQYVLDQRRRYNNSNGNDGSFIVAINLSSGLSNRFPHENPVFQQWCNMYELLGEQGVLSTASAPNTNTNVDIEGDMPATCGSPYLIVVTNTDNTSQKVADAGYGKQFVHIGAPGEKILTTIFSTSQNYGLFSGTSAASPMVAGCIGLLYSVQCPNFGELLKVDRVLAMMSVKNALLESGDKVNSLLETVSGSNLNLFEAIKAMQIPCDGTLLIPSPLGNLEIQKVLREGNKFRINYISPDDRQLTLSIYDLAGRLIQREKVTPQIYGDRFYKFDDVFNTTGMYLISLSNEKDIHSVKLFVNK